MCCSMLIRGLQHKHVLNKITAQAMQIPPATRAMCMLCCISWYVACYCIMLQGSWQSAADHLMGQYKHLLQQQQQQQKAKESLIKDASTNRTLNDAQQQEQLHQAEHIWGGLQVCTLLWTLIAYVSSWTGICQVCSPGMYACVHVSYIV